MLEVAKANKPKLIVAGASAYPRKIDFKKFREIADEVGAYLMVDMAHIAGLVMHVIASKAVCFKEALSPEFQEYGKNIVANAQALAKGLTDRGFDLVSGGTDNHLMLVDLRSKNITGKEFEIALDKANITCNKNAIPNDPQKQGITSGVRIGTPAVTTRGLNEADMDVIAECMALIAADPEGNNEAVKAKVKALTDKYPLYA